MYDSIACRASDQTTPADQDAARERRLALLLRRLPPRLRAAVRCLRRPGARWVRLPAGGLLILGGLFSILPILGLWMLPLGLLLIAQDVPPLRRASGRLLAWIERHRPHWLGLAPTRQSR